MAYPLQDSYKSYIVILALILVAMSWLPSTSLPSPNNKQSLDEKLLLNDSIVRLGKQIDSVINRTESKKDIILTQHAEMREQAKELDDAINQSLVPIFPNTNIAVYAY